MKETLNLEELGLFFFGLFLFSQLDYQWWVFAALFFVPDVGMLGYLAGNTIGALSYNLLHHKGIAVACFMAWGKAGWNLQGSSCFPTPASTGSWVTGLNLKKVSISPISGRSADKDGWPEGEKNLSESLKMSPEVPGTS